MLVVNVVELSYTICLFSCRHVSTQIYTHTHKRDSLLFKRDLEDRLLSSITINTFTYIYIYSKCVCVCVCVNKCFVVFCCVICADERRLLKTKQRERERERDIIVCWG